MELVQNHVEHFYRGCGYNCAETIFCAACTAWGLEFNEDTLKLMAGFGGGMGSGNVCGAVTGSVAALSYRHAQEGGGHKSPYLMEKVRLFMRTVKHQLEDETCRTMKPRFYSKETKCLPTIMVVAKILDDVEQMEVIVPEKK